MSIHGELLQHLEDRAVVHVAPYFGPQIRSVYATADVFRQLDDETANEASQRNAAQLRSWLDNFSRGNTVIVGGRKSKCADMKRLECAGDIWEIRKRKEPSTRIFGCFIEHDMFMALGVHLVSDLFVGAGEIRNWLGEKVRDYLPNWDREIRNSKAEWRRLFHTYQPHSAETVSGYLSFARHERDI